MLHHFDTRKLARRTGAAGARSETSVFRSNGHVQGLKAAADRRTV